MPLPLAHRWPRFATHLCHLPLGSFPTPLEPWRELGEALGVPRLWVKRDDAASPIFGGNKVRKLELLLGDVVHRGLPGVLTYGTAGSHQVAATAAFANHLGLNSVALLLPQAPAAYARRNLLLAAAAGCRLRLHPTGTSMRRSGEVTRREVRRFRERHGGELGIVPFGGTSSRGTVGYVNAALELSEQVAAGKMPPPDRIYVACASMGTATGLALGLHASPLHTRVTAVRIGEAAPNDRRDLASHLEGVVSFLRSMDPAFPSPSWEELPLDVRDGVVGPGYGFFTAEATAAVRLARRHQGADLDGLYTGKALAALGQDAKAGLLAGQTVLFWNTVSSVDQGPRLAGLDPRRLLPESLHGFFAAPLQPHDPGSRGGPDGSGEPAGHQAAACLSSPVRRST